MVMSMLKKKIEAFCEELGLDTVGCIPCRQFEELKMFYEDRKEKQLQNEFEENDIEKRIQPNHYMKEAKTIISIAFPYLHEEEMVENGFSVYTKRFDYHRVVKSYLDKICIFIESLGGKAESFVDSNTLPERYIAYLAGLGFIGRNNMLITKKYGSYVFLGEILTDLELTCEEKRSFEEIGEYAECGTCKNCIGECPTKSINTKQINPNICLSYITQKKEITKQEMGLLKGNIFGCDFCQLKCPYNLEVEMNRLQEFAGLEWMNQELTSYATMDNQFFKEKISKTSCGWRGKNVIRRNAIIGLHYQGGEHDIEKLKGDSPYINKYIELLMDEREGKV